MPTSPERVRRGLQVVTSAAQADVRAVVAASESPAQVRAALFAAAPLIVSDYIDGAAALALDWYEELREFAAPGSPFTPTPLTLVTDDIVTAMVAATTEALREVEAETEALLSELIEQASANVASEVQKEVASGFWDTITGNVERDPNASGWARFTRPGACKFCLMLADRGGVYKRSTARFAAHATCHCVAAPVWDPDAAEATEIQYVASERRRTDSERAALRRYLNENFPDAPG